MAKIPINIGGGGSSLEPTGNSSTPIYIDDSGNAQVCSTISAVTTTASSGTVLYFVGSSSSSTARADQLRKNNNVYITTSNTLRGACWNDYAETRRSDTNIPGTCVKETSSGIMTVSQKRLEKACSIISDTYGFLIGEEGSSLVPIAVSGRVLSKIDSVSKIKIGDPVCSGKNGTVSKMNRLECILYPDRIIGFISEIPEYLTWNNVEVNNRVWIRIK